MFIFPENLENEVFFLYLHNFSLNGWVCSCLLHTCLFIWNPTSVRFCVSFMLFSPRDSTEAFTLDIGEWKLSPSSFTLPNILLGFANKKNKLNLIHFSPQAILFSPEGFRVVLHVCALLCCTYQFFSSWCPNVMETPDKQSNGRWQSMMLEKWWVVWIFIKGPDCMERKAGEHGDKSSCSIVIQRLIK